MNNGTSLEPSLTQRLVQEIAVLCHSYNQILAVYLHGSWGSQYERSDSDLDLSILSRTHFSLDERLSFTREIETLGVVDCLVDLSDLRCVDTVFSAIVVATGSRIYALADAEMDIARFEMKVMSGYAHLNEERAGILRDIAQRGTVYSATQSAKHLSI